MADPKKYKSVAVDLPTYVMLKKMAESYDRPIIAQMRRMIKNEYNLQFGNELKDGGIGSAKT
jgi:hypothetical protein